MSEPRPLSADDLETSIGATERAALEDVAARLIHERPAPRAGFRAELHARLRELGSSGRHRPRPAWLWQRVSVLVLCGGGLLTLVGVGLSGAGPFAP